jgi:hypothetical protein
MVGLRFRDGHELRLPLGADAFEAQGCLHVLDAWGLKIESFETAELAEWWQEAGSQAAAPALHASARMRWVTQASLTGN